LFAKSKELKRESLVVYVPNFRSTGEIVSIAQRAADEEDESAGPTLISLHNLRSYLDTSYRMTIDLPREMPQIIGEIGRFEADFPHGIQHCVNRSAGSK
jgi:hypothetical protein